MPRNKVQWNSRWPCRSPAHAGRSARALISASNFGIDDGHRVGAASAQLLQHGISRSVVLQNVNLFGAQDCIGGGISIIAGIS